MVNSAIKKIHMLRIKKGEDIFNTLTKFVNENNIRSGMISAIGALSNVTLGYLIEGKYETIKQKGKLEVGSCLGNISVKEGKPFVHVHLVCQDINQVTIAGHVLEGCIVNPTLEVIILEFKEEVNRKFDEDSQIYLWDI